jgi:hypothetical protein
MEVGSLGFIAFIGSSKANKSGQQSGLERFRLTAFPFGPGCLTGLSSRDWAGKTEIRRSQNG